MQPSTVLFLAANPLLVQPLQLGEECRAIEDKIRAAKFRDQIRFRSRWAARPADLLQALNEDIPKVLHFSGHGTGDQGLCFQSEDGSPLHMSTDVLTQIMRAAGASVTIVVLNACYSEVQAQALVAHVPCVIGMSNAIGDEAAIIYAESFYCALASGRSVANAHEQGIIALGLPMSSRQTRDVKLAGAAQCASTPRLLIRPDTDADCIYIVRGPMKTRCVVVIKATLREFNADVLTRVTEELRQLTGDLSLQITDIEEGSVRLTVSLSPEAARDLMKRRANGQLNQVCGFNISMIIEIPTAMLEARTVTDVAVWSQEDRLVYALRRTGSGLEFPDGGASESQEVAWWAALPRDTGKVPVLPRTSTRAPDPDPDIVSLINAGDRRGAISSLMKRYGTEVYGYCLRVLRDSTLAADVRQHTFLEAYRDLESVSGRSSFRAWLFGIARHRTLDALKARQRVNTRIMVGLTDETLASSTTPGERIDEAHFREALFACLNELHEDVRSVLLLRVQQGHTYEGLAEVYGEAPDTKQVRVERALRVLRRCLEARIGRKL